MSLRWRASTTGARFSISVVSCFWEWSERLFDHSSKYQTSPLTPCKIWEAEDNSDRGMGTSLLTLFWQFVVLVSRRRWEINTEAYVKILFLVFSRGKTVLKMRFQHEWTSGTVRSFVDARGKSGNDTHPLEFVVLPQDGAKSWSNEIKTAWRLIQILF